MIDIIICLVILCCIYVVCKHFMKTENFEFLSATLPVDRAKKPNMCVIDTSIIHEHWITTTFQIHRTPNPLKESYIYADTATYPKIKSKYLVNILAQHRVVILFTKDAVPLTLPLTQFISTQPISTVWVRTDVEKQLAKIIFASTVPSSRPSIEYTTDPLSRSGIYCLLVDMADPVLNYARRGPCTILTYDDMNIDHSRYFMPYHDLKHVDVASLLDRPLRDGVRTRCMAFPYCIWSSHDHVSPPPHMTVTHDTYYMAGFYVQFFNVCRYVLTQAERHYTEDIPMPKNTTRHTMVESKEGRRVISGPSPPPKGDTWVEIRDKDHTYENSHVTSYSNLTETVSINTDHVIVKIPGIPQNHTKVYLDDLDKIGDVIQNANGMATVVVWLTDIETRDRTKNGNKYSCVTNAKLEFDFQCEAEQGGVWDRPCQDDFECPFYNVDSGRGGCDTIMGHCEMPLGMKRTGFRKYDPATKAFCKDCPDPLSDPYCCDVDASRFAFAMNELGENITSVHGHHSTKSIP